MTALELCSIFALTAGFAKLSTMILNRMLAIPQPKWVIFITELIQLWSMPIYAITLFMVLSHSVFKRPLDLTFFNDSVAVFANLLVILGVIGFGLLVWSTIVFQTYSPPTCQIAAESEVVDFRKLIDDPSWKDVLVGTGSMRRVALLPGNEQFSIEVSTKTYLLPRLAREWDGLSIVHLADTHFQGGVTRPYFEAVCERANRLKPDLFVFTGDLLDNLNLLDWFPETFGKLQAPLGQYFVLGNHDWYLSDQVVRKEFERYGWIDISGRSMELASLTDGPPILIAGDETPWMGKHPSLDQSTSNLFRILVSHTPDNINWARSNGIDLMFAGHTHGGQIRLPVLGPVYSPSRFGCRFASGVFWLEPTLMYVSRGISGREPIRYRCSPELTKVVVTTRPTSGMS